MRCMERILQFPIRESRSIPVSMMMECQVMMIPALFYLRKDLNDGKRSSTNFFKKTMN